MFPFYGTRFPLDDPFASLAREYYLLLSQTSRCGKTVLVSVLMFFRVSTGLLSELNLHIMEKQIVE